MGSRKCGGCLSCLLIPLALWSIIVNILLYFPNGQVSYAASNKLTNYVWYFEGICFSGVMMLMVAVVLLVLDNESCYHVVDYLFCSGNCFLWIQPGHICSGSPPGPILPHPRWLGICLRRHRRTFSDRFQHVEPMSGAHARGGVERDFVFHPHSPQWTSGDRLPRQNLHSAFQDPVRHLLRHHPAWNHLNMDKSVSIVKIQLST
ncbi:transmembrane 4 L6 family member 18 isoform 1-T1 [Callospermophilus lateralis]